MISVSSYLKVIPPGNSNKEKPLILTNFIEGVNTVGDKGSVVFDRKLVKSDVALVQGFVHKNSKRSSHLLFRKEIIDYQKKNNNRVIFADSNLFLYADKGNSKSFLRYSYDGIFPTTGEYCNSVPDPNRWQVIKKSLDIELLPWHFAGKYILLCCQRDGGWSMDGVSVTSWILDTVASIRKETKLPIVIRFHPGDRRSNLHKSFIIKSKLKNVTFSNTDDITQDIDNSRVVITYNSSPAVVAAIRGKPVISLDATRSQARDVSHSNISQINDLIKFDREEWILKIAQMHWNLSELKQGIAWEHMRKWAKK